MVLHEFLPMLTARGLTTSRLGLLGWSMGGYGALYLAGQLRTRAAAVIAESPALWLSAADTAAGAFDDAADFQQHTIFGRLELLEDIALRIDCGDQDGFAAITRLLRQRLGTTPAGGIEPGGHDARYWRGQAAAQLRFAGRWLAGG
jgi:enterochelin esterase-like enzyme